jgi:hypothetical protein
MKTTETKQIIFTAPGVELIQRPNRKAQARDNRRRPGGGSVMVEVSFTKFVAKWSAEHPYPLPAGPLLHIAEECGVSLNGSSTKGKESCLGKLICAHIGVPVELAKMA